MGSGISLATKTVLHRNRRQLLSVVFLGLSARLVRRFRYPLEMCDDVGKMAQGQRN